MACTSIGSSAERFFILQKTCAAVVKFHRIIHQRDRPLNRRQLFRSSFKLSFKSCDFGIPESNRACVIILFNDFPSILTFWINLRCFLDRDQSSYENFRLCSNQRLGLVELGGSHRRRDISICLQNRCFLSFEI